MSEATAVELAVKTCSKCGETKSLTDFYRDRKARDGRHGLCIPCHREETDAATSRRRAEMGEKAFRAHQAEIVRRHRERTKSHLLEGRIQREVDRRLHEAHREEYEALCRIVRYEMRG